MNDPLDVELHQVLVSVFTCYSVYNNGLAVCDEGGLENECWFHHIGLVEHGVGHVLNLIDASGDHPQAFALHLLVVGSNKLNPRGSSLGVTVKDIIEFDS